MAHKDGEASVEDILRSIKQVISRDESARRPVEDFPREGTPPAAEGEPPRPAGFAPYSFQRHSPFGARQPEAPPPSGESEEGEEARPDVFDLRSLDSGAFEVDEPEAGEEPAAGDGPPMASGFEDEGSHEVSDPYAAPEPEPIHLEPPAPASPETEADIGWSDNDYTEEEEDEAESPYVEDPLPAVGPAVSEDEDEGTDDDFEPVAKEDGGEEPEAIATSEPEPGLTDGLIAGAAADTLRDRFSALQAAASAPGNAASAQAATPANPLEDMVREMLRPMLKQWLDDNMPGLVEKIVEREIARITGRL